MFNKLSEVQKEKRRVLTGIIKTGELPKDIGLAGTNYIVYNCYKNKYLGNIVYSDKNANGIHFFQLIKEDLFITEEGLLFLKETSKLNIIVQNLFKIFKGLLGYILGILSTLLVTYLIWKFNL